MEPASSLIQFLSQQGNAVIWKGYAGKAEYFAVYVPETGRIYMVSVNEAPKTTDMTLRFKNRGVIEVMADKAGVSLMRKQLRVE